MTYTDALRRVNAIDVLLARAACGPSLVKSGHRPRCPGLLLVARTCKRAHETIHAARELEWWGRVEHHTGEGTRYRPWGHMPRALLPAHTD